MPAHSRLDGSEFDRLISAVIETRLQASIQDEGKQHQVFLLSGPDEPDTVRLPHPIVNDTVAESGRTWAWTMGQRYVSLSGLTRPGVSVTSDLAAG